MGVFKNGVGRPSNETIKKRNIFKVICVLLILVIIVLIGYILNDKNVDNKEPKTTTKNVNKTDSKYKNFKFVKSTSAGTIDGTYKIENGRVSITSDYGEKTYVNDLKNAKYIVGFNWSMHDADWCIVVLSSNGKLYDVTSGRAEEVKFNKNIKELYYENTEDYDKQVTGLLYVLTGDDELLKVNVNYSEKDNLSIGDSYDKRNISIGCSDGVCYNGSVDASSKKLTLDLNGSIKNIKYNGKFVKVKYLFKVRESDTEKVYVVTTNDELLETKEGLSENKNDDECYEFVSTSNSKVVKVEENEYTDEYETTNLKANVVLENGKSLEYNDVYNFIDLSK